jgi:hypothetical protein
MNWYLGESAKYPVVFSMDCIGIEVAPARSRNNRAFFQWHPGRRLTRFLARRSRKVGVTYNNANTDRLENEPFDSDCLSLIME